MENKWKSTFHRRINELYDAAKDDNYKTTQEEYAKKLGTTRSSLRGWLEGKGQPDADGLVFIAKAEGTSVDWLVGNSDIRSPITTIAAHRTDDPRSDLPEEAQKSVDEFIELMKIKHGINKK